MNQVEETVLIPKDEYESLIKAVSSKETKQTDMLVNEEANVDKPGIKSAMFNSVENPKDTSEPKVATFFDHIDNGLVKSPESVSNKGTRQHDDNHDDYDAVNEDNAELKDSQKSVSAKLMNDEKQVETEVQDLRVSNNLAEDSSMMSLLLDKVSTKLRQPVKRLAAYIAENGQGIIAWDKKLRFILFNEVIPRTNFAKLISHTLEKGEKKRPKGATMFGKALQSIGMTNPAAWAFSQVTSYSASPDKSVDETKHKQEDYLDGSIEKKKGSNKTKIKKLNKLEGKWLSW